MVTTKPSQHVSFIIITIVACHPSFFFPWQSHSNGEQMSLMVHLSGRLNTSFPKTMSARWQLDLSLYVHTTLLSGDLCLASLSTKLGKTINFTNNIMTRKKTTPMGAAVMDQNPHQPTGDHVWSGHRVNIDKIGI